MNEHNRAINHWLAMLNAETFSDSHEARYEATDQSAKVASIVISALLNGSKDESYVIRRRANEALHHIKGLLSDESNT